MSDFLYALVMLPFMAAGFVFETARTGFNAGREAAIDAMRFFLSRSRKSDAAEKAKP